MTVRLHAPAEGKPAGETYTGDNEKWLVANGVASWVGEPPAGADELLLADDPTNPANREAPDEPLPGLGDSENAAELGQRGNPADLAGDPSRLAGDVAGSSFAQADASQAQPTVDSQATVFTQRVDPNVNPHTDDPTVPDSRYAAPVNPEAGVMQDGDDPKDFTVAQVQAHLASASDEERDRVLEAEAAGKNRATLVG